MRQLQKKSVRLLAVLLAFSGPLVSASPAEEYPTRPVTIVVPLAAGASADIVARLLAHGLTQEFGQPFIVENRPGAGTAIGDLPTFRYCDFGAMATIGRKHAVAEMSGLRLSGHIAWLLWCLAHIYFLIGFRNRLSVALNWIWKSRARASCAAFCSPNNQTNVLPRSRRWAL